MPLRQHDRVLLSLIGTAFEGVTSLKHLLARAAVGVVEGTTEALVIDDADRLCGVRMHDRCVMARDRFVLAVLCGGGKLP